jgi:hypothetical protein
MPRKKERKKGLTELPLRVLSDEEINDLMRMTFEIVKREGSWDRVLVMECVFRRRGRKRQMEGALRMIGEFESFSGMRARSEEERGPDRFGEGLIELSLVEIVGLLELRQGAEEERGSREQGGGGESLVGRGTRPRVLGGRRPDREQTTGRCRTC